MLFLLGLTEPVLIRLDVDSKLSDQIKVDDLLCLGVLWSEFTIVMCFSYSEMMIFEVYNLFFSIFCQLSFFHVRVDDKAALLLYLLRNVVKPQEQTVVFAATKHHVEYLKEVRCKLHFSGIVLLNANSSSAFLN